MSYDTIPRIEQAVTDLVLTPNSIFGYFSSLNEDRRDQGSGPYILTSVEPFTDDLNNVFSTSKAGFFEEGVAVLQIFDEKGSGTRDLYTIYGQIRDAFRSVVNPSKQFKLYPTGSQEGTITFNTFTQRPVVEVDRRSSSRDWLRLDVLIDYNKHYDVTA